MSPLFGLARTLVRNLIILDDMNGMSIRNTTGKSMRNARFVLLMKSNVETVVAPMSKRNIRNFVLIDEDVFSTRRDFSS